jgi:hypothetical protein
LGRPVAQSKKRKAGKSNMQSSKLRTLLCLLGAAVFSLAGGSVLAAISVAVLSLCQGPLYAQASGRPDVLLAWDHVDSPPVVTFDMERAALDCTAAQDSDFAKINTAPIAAKTYTDSNRAPGRYCYRVFAVAGGLTSPPSNRASADVPPAPPTNLTGNLQFAFELSPDGTLRAKLQYHPKPNGAE